MIMLMGLPGCGKTTWTEKHVSEHPEKRYNVIGTTRLEDRMNVSGFEQKNHGKFCFYSKLLVLGQWRIQKEVDG